MQNNPNESKEMIPATSRAMQPSESVDIESLKQSWQQIDLGAKVGVMRGMEFGAGGRAIRLINSSLYHRASTTMPTL